jgi:hypothetical protein
MSNSAAILSVLCAIGGYRFSVRSGLLRGITPWRMPSIVWGIICLTGPLGLLLEFVAVRTTKPATASVGSPQVIAGQQWSPLPTSTPVEPVVEPEPRFAAPDDGSGKMALFGWYADPAGRHAHRYWDGRGWTSLVEDDSVTSEDPL